jgi:hypothetical protein
MDSDVHCAAETQMPAVAATVYRTITCKEYFCAVGSEPSHSQPLLGIADQIIP